MIRLLQHKKIILISMVVLFGLLFDSNFAQASLTIIGTAEYNGQTCNLIYDDDDTGHGGGGLVWLDFTNGATSWLAQKAWVGSLETSLTNISLNGYIINWAGNWRLPDTVDGPLVVGSGGDNPPGSGIYDYTSGYNLTNSEMGHLFTTELGNLSFLGLDGQTQFGFGLNNAGPFSRLQSVAYWSDTEFSSNGNYAWWFSMNNGRQEIQLKDNAPWNMHMMYGMAVRAGEAISVPIAYTLGVSVTGQGTVHSTPGTDMQCIDNCTKDYDEDTVVTLTANPATNYSFDGWAGDCTGTGDCVVPMDAAKNVSATFSIALGYDVPVTETLSTGTEVDFFSFTGNAGDAVQINLHTLSIGIDAYMILRDSSGTELTTASCSGRNAVGSSVVCSAVMPYTLPAADTYTVSMSDYGFNNAGNYVLQLEKLFPAIAPTVLDYDIAVTETLSPATDMDFFSFIGNAGDAIQLNLLTMTTAIDAVLTLRDANGTEVATASCSGRNAVGTAVVCSIAMPYTLPAGGTYTVSMSDYGFNNAGNYVLQLEKLFPAIAPTVLDYDIAVTETLSPATDMDFFSFIGNAGDAIQLNLLTMTTAIDAVLTLRDANGTEVATASCSGRNAVGTAVVCSIAMPYTLPAGGTYTVSMSDYGFNNAGNYVLQLEKIFPAIAPTVLDYDVPVTETLSPATDMDFFSFTGNAGDAIQINLHTLSIGIDAYMILRDSSGTELTTASCSGRNTVGSSVVCSAVMPYTLPAADTYTVSMSDYGFNNAGNYEITLVQGVPNPVRLESSQMTYPFIQSAYDMAPTGEGAMDTIKIKAGEMGYEDLNFDREVIIRLQGGYDNFFSIAESETKLDGTLTIWGLGNTVIIDKLIIK